MTSAQILRGKRVLFFLCSLNMGGGERQALLLADHLHNELGARVEYWGMDTSGLAAEECERLGIPWRRIPFDFTGQLHKKIWMVFRFLFAIHGRFDILLPYTSTPGILCGLTWRLSGAQLCIWNQRNEKALERESWIEKLAVRCTPAFISNSQAGTAYLTHYGARPDQIAVIHNGIQLQPSQLPTEQWRSALKISAGTRVVTMVANLQANKDHETLLRAWQIVVRSITESGQPPAVLVLAGKEAQTAERMHRLASELRIEDSVIFAGAVKDITGLLRMVDIAVLSSPSEGLPNGVLEAMAAGLPVAGSDIAGIREAVGPRGWEFLAPAGDAQGLAQRLLHLLGDADLRSELGKANQERIEQEFSPQKMYARSVEFINCHLQK